jgi:beta-phosphoglucomutase-like phosphatase (HAD superfamily)
MHKEVKAVIFDFDGLMAETEEISTRAWDRIAEEYGITIGSEYYSRVRGTNYEGGKRVFLELYGSDMPYDRIKKEKNAYFAEDVDKNGIGKKKGLDELLEYIDAHGIAKAIASGSTADYVKKCSEIAKINSASGCGSAWLERLVWDQEVAGSNPVTPTHFAGVVQW